MPDGQLVSSQPLPALLVAGILLGLGLVIVRRVSEAEGGDPWLRRALTVCLILHLVSAPLQIWVVNHLYGGIADYNRYDSQGALLATGFRHLDFSLAPGQLGGIVSNGSVSIVAGAVFALLGTNQVAAFLLMSWLAFIGIVCFYRAFSTTFSGIGNRRYGYMIFFLPSLIFWTSDVSKEAIMTFLLGVTAYACARILAGRGSFMTWLLIIVCSIGGAFIRPNQMLLAVGGFAIAMLFRPMSSNRRFQPGRRTASTVFLAVFVGLGIFVTLHFMPGLNGSLSLSTISSKNSGTGAGFGSSGVTYSGSPLYYPKDVFVVLLDPLPFNAHGNGELLEAAENMVLLSLILASLRHLRILPRASLARPYLLMCTVFVAAFAYAFAALGNLGLITRESTVMLPFFLVLLCIPRAPRGNPPRYMWELRRRDRVALRRAARARANAPGGRVVAG